MTVIRSVSGAAGFNVGMNQGSAGGAGIRAHLHQHVVPRWIGDPNFMPVIGRTKTMPQLLGDTRDLLARAWESRPSAGIARGLKREERGRLRRRRKGAARPEETH